MHLVEVLQPEPLGGKARPECLGPGIGQHPPGLSFQFPVVLEPSALGEVDELGVGLGAPEECGHAGRQSQIADLVTLARLDVLRLPLDAEDEVGARQDGLERPTHPRLEARVTGAVVVERHQPGHVALVQGTPVGGASDLVDDPLGAGALSLGGGGPTAEDAPARLRLGNAGDVVGAADDEALQVRQGGLSRASPGSAGQGPLRRLDQVVVGTVDAADEGGGHAALSGPDERRVGLDGRAAAEVGPTAREGPGSQQGDGLAVDGDVDILVTRAASALDHRGEDVLAVGRKIMGDHDAAASAVGRALHVLPSVLRSIWRGVVGGVRGIDVGASDRQAADFAGGVQIRVEVGRGERLDIGDVVEILAHLVERKPDARIDLDSQQFADGRRVLCPIQPLEGSDTRVGMASVGFIDVLFKRLYQGKQDIRLWTRHARRRHHAGAQLADHAFRELGIVGRALDREFGERDVAGQQRVVVADLAVGAHDRGQLLRGHGRGVHRMRRGKSFSVGCDRA